MTRDQEQAASAARRACVERLRTYPGATPPSEAVLSEWTHYALANVPINSLQYTAIKNAYLAAWRVQWEAR